MQSPPSAGGHQPIAGEWETKASPNVTGGKRPPTTPSAIASKDYFWATSGPTSAGTAAVGDHRHAYHRFIGLAAAWTAHNRAQPAPESAASGEWLRPSAAPLMRIYSLTLPSSSPSPPHSLHNATVCICAPGVVLSDSPRNLLQPRRPASYLTPSVTPVHLAHHLIRSSLRDIEVKYVSWTFDVLSATQVVLLSLLPRSPCPKLFFSYDSGLPLL